MKKLLRMGLTTAAVTALTFSGGAALAGMHGDHGGGGGGGGEMTNTQAKNISQIVASDPRFTTLNKALKATGLDKTLAQAKNVTVFAPTNEAFAALPADQLAQLMTPQGKQQLTTILKNHVVQGVVASKDLFDNHVQRTMAGEIIAFDVPTDEQIAQAQQQGGGGGPVPNVTVAGAEIIQADVQAKNGVIHVIDEVLVP